MDLPFKVLPQVEVMKEAAAEEVEDTGAEAPEMDRQVTPVEVVQVTTVLML
jgi:hypothetical protein